MITIQAIADEPDTARKAAMLDYRFCGSPIPRVAERALKIRDRLIDEVYTAQAPTAFQYLRYWKAVCEVWGMKVPF